MVGKAGGFVWDLLLDLFKYLPFYGLVVTINRNREPSEFIGLFCSKLAFW